MSNTFSGPFPQTGSDSFPKDLFLLEDFKVVVNGLFAQTSYAKKRRFYVHQPYSFVFVKLYALTRGVSTHQASNKLNELYHEQELDCSENLPKKYRDKRRSRRLVPHQTDVDLFFKAFSEQDVQILFGGLLNYITYKIVKEQCRGRKWLSMVDNTKYPYYGVLNPLKHIGTKGLPGTKHAWMFQGVSLQSEDIHIYTQFYSLTLGIYRALMVPYSVDIQRALGVKTDTMVFDREFYRATLVSDLRKRKMKVLFPTKKYQWVKHHMTHYLRGTGGLVVGNIFAQAAQHYPFQSTAFVRMVIIGKDNQGAWEVREKFRQGKLTFSKAMRELRGFFTTYTPWKNQRAWARFLVREYKRRWNIETGFSMLNKVHESGRERRFTTKLATIYCRSVIYNWWQSWRLERKRYGFHHRDHTLNEFKEYVGDEIEKNYLV